MRFEFIAGALCLDFANTIHDSRAEDTEEDLCAIADLLQWGKEAGLLSADEHSRLTAHYNHNPRAAASALAKGTEVRDLLLAIFAGIANGRSVSPQRLAELNSALADMPAVLRAKKDRDRIETEWRCAAEGLPQIFFAVLTSAAELLASDRLERIRECASADCTWLFIDESRNHTRRWCDMSACGNRMKAHRYYHKAAR